MAYGYQMRRSPFVPTPLAGNPNQITDEQGVASIVNVSPSGDTGGATDAANINAAIAAAMAGGLPTVKLAGGQWYISSSITLNQSNIALVGSGNGHDAFLAGAAGPTDTVINSSVNGPAIKVAAASDFVTDWVVSNMLILTPSTTAATSATGVTVDSAEYGTLENVNISVLGASQIALLLNPSQTAPITTASLTNAFNVFQNVQAILNPAATSATFLRVVCGTTSNDVNQNLFNVLFCQFNHSTHVGIYLGNCDNNWFYNVIMGGGSANQTATCIKFDYTNVVTTRPSGNVFVNTDTGFNMTNSSARIVNVGVPTIPALPSPNVFYGFGTGNGAVQSYLANLEYYGIAYTRVQGTLGYAPGAGTTAVQSGTTASPVTANAICGTITTVNASWTAGFTNGVQFIVNNNQIASTDTITVNHVSTTGVTVTFLPLALSPSNGTFSLGVIPLSTGTSVAVVNFSVIKAVNT